MIADDTQEELSMEEILSSIKDILDEGMQPNAGAGKTQAPQPEASEPVVPVSAAEETSKQPEAEELIVDGEPAIPTFAGLDKAQNDELQLPVIDEDDDILDLSSAMIIPEKAAENADVALSEAAAAVQPEEKTENIGSLDDVDLAGLELPDLSDVHVETALPAEEEKNPLDELAQSPFYQQQEPETDTVDFEAEIKLPEDNRGLLSDILNSDEPEEAAAIPPIAAEEAEPSDLRVGEEIVEYTVDADEAEPFYPETESAALPVVEPDEGQIVNEDVLEDYKTRENEMPESPLPASDNIEAAAPDGDDVNDVSAGIINSFAKMFSHAEEVAPEPHPKKNYDRVESLGNGALTIEDIVESVVYDVVSTKVDAALQDNTTIENFAKNEIARQTQIWLTTQMPSLIEALVKKEIERVMAKVGR